MSREQAREYWQNYMLLPQFQQAKVGDIIDTITSGKLNSISAVSRAVLHWVNRVKHYQFVNIDINILFLYL
jgi:hypothetical protein